MTRYTCAICGRRTTPFVFVGTEAIGPRCAKRAGLTTMKLTRSTRVRAATYKPDIPKCGSTLDLFEDMDGNE